MKLQALKVLDVRPETPDAYSIVLEKPAEGFDYLPGQYLTVRALVNGRDERRAFSLSSTPTDPHLQVTIKALPDGTVSPHLKAHLKPGDRLEVFPPMGKFVLKPSPTPRHVVLLGAGSGITPLMSMLRQVLAHEPESAVTLLYCNRSLTGTIFRAELEKLAAQHPDAFRLVLILTKPDAAWNGPTGRLGGALAQGLLDDALAARPGLPVEYYMCGPNAMMDDLNQVLAQRGVAPGSIFREYYSAPIPDEARAASVADAETNEVYELRDRQVLVHLDGRTYTVPVPKEKYVLHALLDFGADPPYACQEGVCCTCRAKVLSGLVSMDEREGLSDVEIAEGFVLTCQCHPLSDDVELEFM